jgi:acyl-CoA thioesterase-1
VSGETSSGTLSRVDWILASAQKPDIVILETGGNDGLRAIDPELTRKNLESIIDSFQASGIEVVLAGMETIQNLGEEYTVAYAAIYPAVAEEKNVILIPFFLEGVAAERSLNQEDGIHPTAEGYQIVAETVYPYVVEAIENYETGQ